MSTHVRYQGAVIKYEDNGAYLEISAEVEPPNKACDVSVVFSFDDWKTVQTKNGAFLKIDKQGKSLYRISIPTENIPMQNRMIFALKIVDHKNNHEEKWDNNNGWNYEIYPDRLRQICLPIPLSPPSQSSPR